ncbi:MAG: hypothetical protein OEZ25_00750 [Candidatus Bathyarchaeota archaeon]|nr:hypothetical protein [Candidatus Bathyarchaeota archaeon]
MPNNRAFVKRGVRMILGCYYYVWYSKAGRHWNETFVHNSILGRYDSRDPDVIKKHLEMMIEAGIDFVIISFWGSGSFEDLATQTVVKVIEKEQPRLRFCLIIERNKFLDHDYLDQKYFQSPNYFLFDGKPLVVTYEKPPKDNRMYMVRYLSYNKKIRHVMPGYDERMLGRSTKHYLPRLNGLTYRLLFKLAMLGNPRLVFIVSWNEYHEQTTISPTKEYGFKYIDLTRELSGSKV